MILLGFLLVDLAVPPSLSALCPEAKPGEIVVCADLDPPKSPYRLPLEMPPERGSKDSISVSSERNALFDFDAGGIGSCPAGPARSLMWVPWDGLRVPADDLDAVGEQQRQAIARRDATGEKGLRDDVAAAIEIPERVARERAIGRFALQRGARGAPDE